VPFHQVLPGRRTGQVIEEHEQGYYHSFQRLSESMRHTLADDLRQPLNVISEANAGRTDGPRRG